MSCNHTLGLQKSQNKLLNICNRSIKWYKTLQVEYGWQRQNLCANLPPFIAVHMSILIYVCHFPVRISILRKKYFNMVCSSFFLIDKISRDVQLVKNISRYREHLNESFSEKIKIMPTNFKESSFKKIIHWYHTFLIIHKSCLTYSNFLDCSNENWVYWLVKYETFEQKYK